MWDLEESGFVLHNLGECYLCRGWWEHYAQHSREADPSLLTAIRRRDRPLEEAKDVADTIAQRDRAIAELRERVNEKDATITEMRRNEERMKEDLGDAHDDLTSAELQIENLEDRLKALGVSLTEANRDLQCQLTSLSLACPAHVRAHARAHAAHALLNAS